MLMNANLFDSVLLGLSPSFWRNSSGKLGMITSLVGSGGLITSSWKYKQNV